LVRLITGGCRSGKSGYALDLVDKLEGQKIFLATCPKKQDDEMDDRIVRHQKEREGLTQWTTLEEPLDLSSILKKYHEEHILIDCMTLWVSNWMYDAFKKEEKLTEEAVSEKLKEVLSMARQRKGETVFVTNETGMGIVPENDLAREFRDLIGRCNQVIGKDCDQLVMMVSGQPMFVKGS